MLKNINARNIMFLYLLRRYRAPPQKKPRAGPSARLVFCVRQTAAGINIIWIGTCLATWYLLIGIRIGSFLGTLLIAVMRREFIKN